MSQAPTTDSSLQEQIRIKGEEIFSLMEAEGPSIFDKNWWYGQIMEWSMKNPRFKTQMFRFVDVLPYLNSGSEVTRHLKEYFQEGGAELPSIFNIGLGLGSLAPGLMASAIRKNVTQMAKMFISGETASESLPKLKEYREKNITFTVDLLGEATLSEKEALEYQAKYLELIRTLADHAKSWKEHTLLDRDHLGPIPKVNVSVKVSALYSQLNIKAWDTTKEILKDRLRPIFQIAKEHGVFINLDMEQYKYKNLTIEVFEELLLEPSFKDYSHWGIVLQAYLRDSLQDAQRLTDFSRRRGTPFTVRLVKGAYWDYETVEAAQRGWPVPVFTNKKESDANFEACAEHFLRNSELVRLALASHNVRTIAAALVHATRFGVDHRNLEIQMLYGMADPIKRALVKMGYRVRQYTPIGELIPGMAYLVRRLLENTSNESFLRSKFADNVNNSQLLADPKQGLVPSSADPQKGLFKNEPFIDFAVIEERREMQNALLRVQSTFGNLYSPIIKNREVRCDLEIKEVNPCDPNQVVGLVGVANRDMAEQAVQSAYEAQSNWKKRPVQERARIVRKLAQLMQSKKYDLAALQVYEVGKTWSEADGDVAEAIDFCRYYADEAERLEKGQRMGGLPGENSHYHYQPRGVVAVIAPWNFPLAILTGMVAAALVTGNTVVLKSAEQSSITGWQLMKLLIEAGVPEGVAHFIPGRGEEVGAHLVDHPRVSMIAFTGSKEVGLKILESCGRVRSGQVHVKKAIVEMGGKNAIIVDNDADLDEAVQGLLYSAFGFQGQKCSACSRVVVLEEIYDRFLDRLVEATRSLKQGSVENPDFYLGAVIDEESFQRLQKVIESGKKEARLLYQGPQVPGGYFIPPTIFADVDPRSFLAQQEFFGPILAVLKAKDMDQALEIANGTEYALTGGLYSRSPAHIERVKAEFECGNLYINRGITGALVERHPFGGFKMSGAGSKTGGPDYLLNFVEPRVVTENTLRRGFAPSEEDAPKG